MSGYSFYQFDCLDRSIYTIIANTPSVIYKNINSLIKNLLDDIDNFLLENKDYYELDDIKWYVNKKQITCEFVNNISDVQIICQAGNDVYWYIAKHHILE